jgi:superfamily I DNA/RNA helicase
MELNTEQRRAVEIGPSDHCVVTACPGSGKTRLLSARAAYLLPRGQGNLVAVTFTHDAAGELRNRIVKAVGEVDVSKRLAASTFHSLALDRLKRHYKHKRGRRLPRLLSGAEQAVLLRRAWELYSEDIDFDDAQVAVEYAK